MSRPRLFAAPTGRRCAKWPACLALRPALLLALLLGLEAATAPSAGALVPERRRIFEERAANEYLVVPAVASLPGIGVFVGIIGSVSNIAGTGIDAGGTLAESVDGSDISVQAAAVREVPTGWAPLTVEYQFGNIKLGNYAVYLPGRDSPNFTIPITAEFRYQFLRPALRFWERRIELGYGLAFFDGFDLDPNGNERSLGQHSAQADLRLDFTDDVVDPQRGMRLGYSTSLPAPQRSPLGRNHGTSETFGGGDDIRVHNYDVSAYWRPGASWLLAWDTQLFQAVGSAPAGDVVRGGSPPLRGYPQGRWSDRYGIFSGLEARYLIPLNVDVDIVLVHGVLESLQLAAFYEVGQVSPTNDTSLYEDLHASYGGGVRALFQAIVLRFDLALSDEGPQTHLTIGHAF